MAEKAYFLSDLHLGSAKEPNSFLLLNFLASILPSHASAHSHSVEAVSGGAPSSVSSVSAGGAPDKISLFLLGDIFDLWVDEHDYFVTKYAPIIEALKRLSDAGVDIHYFEGNHDLYLQKFFGEKLGFSVHTGPERLFVCGKNLHIEHGDQMDPTDRGYIFLRWFLRTPFMKWVAPRLPGWLVVRIGESMSKASRQYTSQVKSISNDRAKKVIYEHAYRAYREQNFEILIAGHVHVTEDIILGFENMKYRVVNLGSWFDHPRVFVMDGDFIGFRRLDTN